MKRVCVTGAGGFIGHHLVTFLKQIESTGSPGGADLGALGPVSDGLFVWIAGLGVIIAFTIWLTSRTS